jgi:hypothetical protein
MQDVRYAGGTAAAGPGVGGWAVALAMLAVGVAVGIQIARQPGRAHAAAAAIEDSFAVCTAPVGDGMEGLFMLDFETGDVSGGVLNQNSAKFSVGYRYNVLKDLGFKAGRVKNPKFLMVPGQVNLMGPQANKLGQAVLYVTDVATGVTAAYGVPWSTSAATAAGGAAAPFPLLLLDVVKPRGGGDKAP